MRAGVLFSVLFVSATAMAQGEPHATPPATPPPAATPAPSLAAPVVEIGAPNHARVFGELVAFDGAADGLAWPALAQAYAARGKPGERAVIAAPRNARILDVLRAVYTLRDSDVEVQTLGPGNEVRPLLLAKRPETRPEGPTCHAAIFVSPEGKIRAAVPGGSFPVKDADELVLSIARAKHAGTCKVRWLAFGGETNDMAWGWVFDVAAQVDLTRAAPGARFVLGERR